MADVMAFDEPIARILAEPAPVLVLDTCAILDILRAPIRAQNRTIEASLSLLSACQDTPRGLWVVVPELVPTEFANNVGTVEEELEKSLKGTDSRVTEINTALALLGLHTHAGTAAFALSGLTRRLRGITSDVLAIALQLNKDDGCIANAANRVILGRAPSAKGKQQLQDCIIWENAITFAEQLRRQGFSKAVVFVSSNTSDYCSDSKIKAELQLELDAVQGSFVTQLPWALAVTRER